ncbi:MAG: TonB-dependent receptor [Proteobacteria bacterium]|nr:TonB-dependent receptor [Pseudomonadota bacterium]HQR02969.1 TonB-dependent receptor [Rhodocyclaceae bacterium]
MNKRRSRIGPVLVSALLVGGGGTALAVEEADENAALPVVLTASRMQQPLLLSPSAVTVIDRDMIARSGARQIADLLRFVPGAIVGYNDGSWPVATLRGLSSTYASGLQVLVDGVSVYSPLWGGMQWNELPLGLNDIERIEVIRGPNAALFGPNAFLGVVNIITREPLTDDGPQLSLAAGGGGIADAAVRYAGGDGPWRYRLAAGQRADNGFDSRPDTERFVYANFRGEYRIDGEQTLQASIRLGNPAKERGDYAVSGFSNQPHTQYGHKADFQLRWSHARSADDELWVQYYHQQGATRDHVTVDLRDTFSLPKMIFRAPLPYLIDIDYQSERDGLELQQTRRWNNDLRSVWGLETIRNTAVSTRIFGTADARSEYLTRAYASTEWQLATGWMLHGATMVERNTLAKSAWSPKIVLTYEAAPGHVFHIGVSRAQRTPSMLEKFSNFYFDIPGVGRRTLSQSSGNAQSESVFSEEVGYAFDIPGYRLSGDMRWFQDRYRGLMAARGGDFVNLDDARLSGADLTLRWRAAEDTLLLLTASHTRALSSDISTAYSASVPANVVGFYWDQALSTRWNVTANYQRVGAMGWTDAGQLGLPMPPIEHLNLRLARRFSMAGAKGELALVVQNALGPYRDYYLGIRGTPQNIADRVAFLQLLIER